MSAAVALCFTPPQLRLNTNIPYGPNSQPARTTGSLSGNSIEDAPQVWCNIYSGAIPWAVVWAAPVAFHSPSLAKNPYVIVAPSMLTPLMSSFFPSC